MELNGDEKRKEFIWNFLELYSDMFYAERDDKAGNLKKIRENISKLLPDYHYLFDDIKFLYKTYNEYFTENLNFILKDNFKSFMEYVFEELYKQKIVSKEVFEELERFLSKFDMKGINAGYGLAGGSV